MAQKNSLVDAVMEVLEDYAKNTAEEMLEIAQQVAKEGSQMLKRTSPRGTGSRKGHYADGWAVKTVRTNPQNFSFVIYNKKKPGLTHLLENGHQLRNGGRARAFPHIAKVEQWCIDEYERRLEANL